jgi:heme-degrading monooxygenase HmoA
MRLINVFNVPPEADEAFMAEWERVRESLAAQDGFAGIALLRALRADVEHRYVDIARVDASREPFASHPGLYEVVHDEGTPDGAGGVVLVNPFEVPAGEDEGFVAAWERVRALLAQQRGYLGTRLHRSRGAADFRFVNVARWSSPLMFSRALQQPEVRQAGAALPHTGHPALYTVVRAWPSGDPG